MERNLDSLRDDLKEFQIELTEKQEEQFLVYYDLLVEWNSFMNLTTIIEFEEVLKKHFLDSVSLIKAVDLKEQKILDIGTGAGFPGIPLKIMFPDLKITLLDSLNKRINFLNKVIETLGLTEITAIHGRAEDYAQQKEYREKFDIVVSRAVSNLSTLSEYCLPYTKIGGSFISYKSERLSEELLTAENAISLFGGKVMNQIDFCLPNSEIFRNLLVIRKAKETPNKYPRKAGLPAKEPILK
jgi:16S rRNA (guanine527-N7)-methyltransferase